MKLKEFMEKKKITVAEMARWVGVSPPTVQAWKFAKAKISVDMAIRIRALTAGEVDFEDMVQQHVGEESAGWIPPLEYLEKYRPDVLKEIEKETKPVSKARDQSKERLISPTEFVAPSSSQRSS